MAVMGVTDQWKALIDITELEPDEVVEFIVAEEVGLGLPTFKLGIRTRNIKLLERVLREGFVFSAAMGQFALTEQYKLCVMHKEVTEAAGPGNWMIALSGFLDNLPYLRDQRMEVYNSQSDKKSSGDVWTAVMKRNRIIPDISGPFDDPMMWLQYNITDRQFLDQVQWHGYGGANNPVLTVINRKAEGRYWGINKVKSKAIHKFGNTQEVPDGGQPLRVAFTKQDGFFSLWSGGIHKGLAQNMERAQDDSFSATVSPLVAPTVGLESNSRNEERVMFNENVHTNWWPALAQNKVLKSALSVLTCTMTFKYYIPIYALDYAEVYFRDVDNGNSYAFLNGFWIVGKVSVTIRDHYLTTSVLLCRDEILESPPANVAEGLARARSSQALGVQGQGVSSLF